MKSTPEIQNIQPVSGPVRRYRVTRVRRVSKLENKLNELSKAGHYLVGQPFNFVEYSEGTTIPVIVIVTVVWQKRPDDPAILKKGPQPPRT